MSLLWIVRLSILMFLQISTSFILIYRGKKKISYCSEIILIFFSMFFYRNILTMNLILLYVIEYILSKIILLIIIWNLKYFSFYALVSISKKNGKLAKICYKIFGKNRFIRFVSKMWNRVDYGIRIKKGIPAMVNRKHRRTGIYFDKDGFPKFKVIATVELDWRFYNQTREEHFYKANRILYKRIISNKKTASKYLPSDIEKFRFGKTPSKYTWHHHQDKGVLQLVDRKIHADVNHRGGFSIWGKRK